VTHIFASGNRRELKVFLGDLMMVMTPSERHHSNTFAEIKVFVEEEETPVTANAWTPISRRGQNYGSIFRSSDNVFQASFGFAGNVSIKIAMIHCWTM
jgi:hypothetical protein